MTDLEVVAKTLYGEARGEGLTGMLAVACVIRNRVEHPTVFWWGSGWQGVCLKPYQFSCWNQGDPNRDTLLTITTKAIAMIYPVAAATAVMSENLPDITNGATHYCTKAVSPAWAKGVKPVAAIGNHVFYIVP